MNVFTLGKLEVPYDLRRSETASRLHLEMTLDGMLVTAPEAVDLAKIEKTLHSKRRWIVENHVKLREKYNQMHKIARFQTGAKVPYWGRLARLVVNEDVTPSVEYLNGISIGLPSMCSFEVRDEAAEQLLREWLRVRLQEEARKHCRKFSRELGVQMPTIRIAALKSRWGSCGENGVVSLNWHLVFGPKRVLAYVIAHELTHLVVRNHGEDFWRKLRAVIGGCQHEHDWLMKNEHLLGYRRIPVKQ